MALATLIFIYILMVACEASPIPSPPPSGPPTYLLRSTPTPTPRPPLVPVEFIVLQPRAVTLKIGQTHQFKVRVLDAFENRVPIDDYSYVFTARRHAGHVDNQGRYISGTKSGIYKDAVAVAVTQDSVTRTATADLTILPGPLDHVSLSPSSRMVQVGQTLLYTAIAFDQFKNPIPGLNTLFRAGSEAGQIDSDGYFTAGTKVGTFKNAITVEVSQGSITELGISYVTVTPGPLELVIVTPNSGIVEVGSQKRFVASATDRYGNNIPGISFTWSVDAGDGNIDASGNFTPTTGPDTHTDTIRAIVTQGNISRSAVASVTVVPTEAATVSVGWLLTCAVTKVGGTKCWGAEGDGTTIASSTPVVKTGLNSGVAAISAGGVHTCAITTSAGVKCWGMNNFGYLGDGTVTDSSKPVGVKGLNSGVAAVSSGHESTCAMTTARGVKCWGKNQDGQLGDGTNLSRLTPVNMIGLDSIVAVSTSGEHACALTELGGLKCWGHNHDGQLGDGTTANRATPVDVKGLANSVTSVSSGWGYTCALTTSGGVKCWGYNGKGQAGDGTTTGRTTPSEVTALKSGVVDISAGRDHTCAVTEEGSVKCWGDNSQGQLGDGTTTDSSTPVDVVGLTSRVASVSSGWGQTCALVVGGGVKCWGVNNRGQLGDGTTTDSSTPVDVARFTQYSPGQP